jgi:hypothetical protein
MSIEATLQDFIFGPINRVHQILPPTLAQRASKSMKRDKLPWTHNHLHDLESLWWVTVWIVIYNHFRLPNEPLPELEQTTLYLRQAQILFPPIMVDRHRISSFRGSFLMNCEGLPENKRGALDLLDFLRLRLIDDYVAVESTLPNSIALHVASDDIYESFTHTFRLLQTESDNYTLYFIPKRHAELERNGKRPRAKSTDITRGSSLKRRAVA